MIVRHKMKYKFNVVFLEPMMEFLGSLEEKSREKILYNIWKSRTVSDPELFKKLVVKYGNLGLCTIKPIYD